MMKHTIIKKSVVSDKHIKVAEDNCSSITTPQHVKQKLKTSRVIDIGLPDTIHQFPYTPRTLSWVHHGYKQNAGCRNSVLSSSVNGSSITSPSVAFKKSYPGCRLANFSFFRILFCGILVSGGDVFSDFLQVR